MREAEFTISNPTGLHARPAKVLVNLAKSFRSDIRIQYGGKTANAKSMVSLLTLGAESGSRITIRVDGEDETAALAGIEAAIHSGLGEGGAAPAPAPEPLEIHPAESPAAQARPGGLRGVAAAPGIAAGPLFHYRRPEIDVSGRSATRAELDAARGRAAGGLAELAGEMTARGHPEEAQIFEAHIEILGDPELDEAIDSAVASGVDPIRAWDQAVQDRAAQLAALPDPLLSARAADLRDVGRRVLGLLLGIEAGRVTLPDEPVILIARELTPSETAAFPPGRVLGFATTEGGPTSHVAILARSLGLPAVAGVDEAILGAADGTPLILDGNGGLLYPDPSPDILAEHLASRDRWLAARRKAQEQAADAAVTKDGRRVAVTANAGSAADARRAAEGGAEGIGLLRTEFLFLDRETAPTEDEQYAVYREIAEAMGERPVILRTLDIGGDKPLAYLPMKAELNPFLGERGLRLCLNRPELFREQLRAILRAAPHGNLKIMFPMVSELAELRQARAIVDELRAELGAQAPKAPALQIGIMIEVPSAAVMADAIAPEIDFFSIGTNDLTQYTLAMDRGHPALAHRQDGLHPAVLRLIAGTIEAAHRHGKRADICGELASDEAAVPILVGLGMDELSVSIPAVPTVKMLVRTLEMAAVSRLAREALQCVSAEEVRALVRAFHAKA